MVIITDRLIVEQLIGPAGPDHWASDNLMEDSIGQPLAIGQGNRTGSERIPQENSSIVGFGLARVSDAGGLR